MNKMSQNEKVLSYLKKHRSITALTAFYKFSILGGLPKIISRLKKQGYLIQTILTTNVNKFNEPVKFATYKYLGKAKGTK